MAIGFCIGLVLMAGGVLGMCETRKVTGFEVVIFVSGMIIIAASIISLMRLPVA